MVLNNSKRQYYLHHYNPTRLRLEASTLCQLHCAGCSFQQNNHENLGGGFLRFSDFKKLVDDNPQINEIELSNWGEIFLNPELVDMMRYAHEKGVSLTAYNGSNFNTVSEDLLQALVNYRFEALSFSIDGASQEVYSKYRIGGNFDTVIENIRRLIMVKKQKGSHYPRLKWQYVINEYNELEVGHAKEIASELGIPIEFKLNWDRSYQPHNPEYLKKETGLTVLTRGEWEAVSEEDYMGKSICGNMFFAPQINWNGDLLGCCDAKHASYGINVFEIGLENALKSESFMRAKECLLTLHPSKEEFGDCICLNCPHRKTREHYGKILELNLKTRGIMAIRHRINRCMELNNNEERVSALLSFMKEGSFLMNDIIVSMADSGAVPPDILSELLSDKEVFGYKSRPIKTVLITTANFYYGGGPRVVANLANAISSEKDRDDSLLYKVIVVSDNEPSPKDYELNPSVTRFNIGARNDSASYRDRAEFLFDLIETENVDLVIQGTKRDDDSLWDMLLCKSHPSRPAYLHICHTSFGSLFNNATMDNFLRRKRLYQYADALVVLNRVDRVCWGAYCPNVWAIPNIIDFAPLSPRKAPSSHRVVWAGRITSQKQPFELIKIAKRAVELLPDIRFDMIGEADSDSDAKNLREEIEKSGLENHVFMCGHNTNMEVQYSCEDLFVHTALYEGFGLVIYEAAAHALPIVMYKIPGLDYMEHLPAIIECEQKDHEQMAREIVDLLTNQEKYAKTSAAVVHQLNAFQKQDQIKEWRRMFAHLEKGLQSPREEGEETVCQAIDSLVFYHYDNIRRKGMRAASSSGKDTKETNRITRLLPRPIKEIIKKYVRRK